MQKAGTLGIDKPKLLGEIQVKLDIPYQEGRCGRNHVCYYYESNVSKLGDVRIYASVIAPSNNKSQTLIDSLSIFLSHLRGGAAVGVLVSPVKAFCMY